jgi:DivIVA domain-containing protein
MRCLECGAEIAERARVCARCGSWAPVEYQLPVLEDWAAQAPYEAAAGSASEAIHADVGQQPPESASDPEIDGAVLAEWVETRNFPTTRLRPGYDMDEVDAFLGAIRDAFLGVGEPSLTPDEIRKKQFSTTRLRPGYDEEEVDAFLDEAESRLAAQVSARCEASSAGPESGAADPAAEAAGIRCLECGAERAADVQVCTRCGAPVAQQRSMSADAAAGGPADPIPLADRPVGQRTRLGSRRNVLVLAGAGLAVLTAVIVVIAVTNSRAPSASSAPSRPSAPSTSPPPPFLVAWDELQAGYCLTGSDLALGANGYWPDEMMVIPCTQRHLGEVFYAGNAWPQSQAYPGNNRLDSQAEDRCDKAFAAYDGTTYDNSVFTYDYMDPDGDDDWISGDRWLACVAYDSTSQYPNGEPLDYSIKGSNQ